MSLNLRQIEVFRAVMLTGSISGASQLLHVSQPAVSRLLAYTEQKVGLVLFERLKGRLYPTPEARRLHQEVEGVYRRMQRVNQTVLELVEKRAAALRVCCSPSLSQTLLPRALAALGASHPEVRIYLDTQNRAEMIDALLTQQFELAVSIQPIEHPSLECRPLYRNPMMAALPVGHPLAQHPALPVAALARERLISYGVDTPLGALIASTFMAAGCELRPAIEVHHTHTACALVQAGAGVALVDGMSMLAGNWPQVVARPLETPSAGTVCAVYARLHALSTLGRELLDAVAHVKQAGPPWAEPLDA